MKLIISIDTNAQGDIGVFMSGVGSPANKTEQLYADGIQKICARFFGEVAVRLNAAGAADVANANGALATTLLNAQWRKGELPPETTGKN